MPTEAIRDHKFLTLEEARDGSAIENLDIPNEHKAVLRESHRLIAPYLNIVEVPHLGYDYKLHLGQLVVYESMRETFQRLFDYMLKTSFPIEKVIPSSEYGYNDELSMSKNNSSAYRPDILGKSEKGLILSKHSVAAVDENTLDNPWIKGNGEIFPLNARGRERWEDARIDLNISLQMTMSRLGLESGARWQKPNGFFLTGHHDYYPSAGQDIQHQELRDEDVVTPNGLDMRSLWLPDGIEYDHPGRLYLANR